MKPLVLIPLLLGSAALPAPTAAPSIALAPPAAAPVYTADVPPPYVDLAANRIEYADPAAIAPLADRWARPDEQVVIAHFGDSHVQKGYITEAARLALEARRGFGGRGMVFPYALAKTYSQNDLVSSFTGVWRTGNSIQQPPRIPVGIAGFAAQTSDPLASVTLTFTRPLDPGAKRVRVFYAAQGSGYTLTLAGTGASREVPATAGTSVAVAVFDLPALADTLSLQVVAATPGAGMFTLLGVSVEDRPARGVLYHNLGVGGAVYGALLQQTWFESEIRAIRPDLVILDWGTNDLIYTDAPGGAFEDTVTRTIARVRRAVPDASILLTSTQDMAFRGRDIDGTTLAAALRRIALAQGCLFWDWFRVSGGAASAAKWRADTLLGADTVHLTGRGYRVKGGLLAAALITALDGTRGGSAMTLSGVR